MSRLYWRIFLSFWAVLLVTLVVTAVFNRVVLQDEVDDSRVSALFASMDALAEQAQRRLDAHGETGLRVWLDEQQARLGVPMFIIAPDGREIRGVPLPPFLRHAGRRAQPELRGDRSERRGRARPESRLLRGAAGDYRFIVLGIERPWRGFGLPPEARRLFPVLLIIVSGLICLLLARYVTRPIRALREAGQRITAGQFDARVGAPVAERRDEFGALARDFDRMADQVETLLRSQQRLLRDVSHELRSPLARLQVAAGLLRQQGGRDEASLDRIEREAETLNTMIGDLLSYARLETRAHVSRETADIVELVRDVADNAAYEAAADGKRVTVEAPEPVSVEVDIGLLQSALDNVLRNAVRYCRQEVRVLVTRDDRGLRIVVRDDGPGVADAALPHLFDAFYTAEASRSAAAGGTGIGLAIAKRSVELQGGRIAALNTGGGFEVSIGIPGS